MSISFLCALYITKLSHVPFLCRIILYAPLSNHLQNHSMRYKPGAYQYTERDMRKRIGKLWFKLLRHRGFDILVTHAPAYQLNDGRDLPHQGFKAFVALIEKYRPKFFLHGHVHMSYGRNHKRYDKYQDTHVINAFERCRIDPKKKRYQNRCPEHRKHMLDAKGNQ